MQEKEMSKIVFQIMGGFALLAAAVILLGGIFTIVRYPLRSWLDLVPFVIVEVVLIVAGIGLLHLRKWAALAFSMMALYVASWELRGALNPIPGYASWLGFLFALFLATPLIVTVVYWRTLSWRRKQT